MRYRSEIAARVVLLVVIPLLAACQDARTQAEQTAHEAAIGRAIKGKELFEERCRTVAGAKIYRTVHDVKGIVLLKLRPERGDRELSDWMWPGAAFARESTGDWYIKTFLGFEYAPGNGLTGKPEAITEKQRGYIAVDRRPGGRPGYQYVDVAEVGTGARVRYTLIEVPRRSSSIGSVDIVLQKSMPVGPSPRYGVTFEDYVVPEERSLGVASSKVRVIDLQTNEILGELTRYAWTTGPSISNPVPWLTAYRCPDEAVGTNAATRKFTDRVLIPYGGQ